ncbi:dephospho-CoA kinase [Bhargavaea beijingensis]|uniref:Dephospho-CoA kinase n=1 Tax=Bhargavaea beijingensis TaxID=426756 RepID=A0A1G7EDS6_9BACL|nr:dephospho-CoA kinase [Bhargavaea beijingensis]MCW1928495.1 dephospho-CoA kinase [Bhargavaea beijingensis]RSK25395.1 dephospho-CoA kinase [Bhargavaea beijingensis]SDE61792.1 dephospho-CoA kinase [Bhargavaea beijingensis]
MIIGLTGSIASGKSTVSRLLEERGFPIVDADRIARIVVEPGQPALEAIRQAFGDDVILEDGSMDRAAVGERIFNNPADRKKLNDIMHPAIRKEMLRQRDRHFERGAKTVVMDIPLLFESRLQHYADKVLVVSVTEETQLKRLMQRDGFSEKEARARIASQLPISEKERGADAVIYNNGTIEESEKQLDRILESWNAIP